ncbi:hypothetical protein [Actinoallomurus sp. CA-150999]|uniref:hypothetical protein n=1 Tax=Actinoallomurus sp. CA-150999 TaxID=3239887 RepID=UPI003D924DFB
MAVFHLFREHDPDDVLRHVRSLIAPGGSAVIVDVVAVYSRSVLRHRWWGVEDAIRTFGRRRSASAIWTVLRLRQHPVWLQHVRTDRTLTRDAFHETLFRRLPRRPIQRSAGPVHLRHALA